MQSSATTFLPGEGASAVTSAKAGALPWYVYLVVMAAACIPIGTLWDISWHSTIGRDTFWTPAHMMIYVGGALPGMVCGWVVLRSSFFSTAEERAAMVSYFGFHGPLGAWVTIWGSLTMLVSAPFDNWWHDAYGLDVEILSPPHTVLALGMYAVAVGAMLLALSRQNRASDEGTQRTAGRLFLFSMGVLIVMASIILTEKSYPNAHRQGAFYMICGVTYSFYLAIASTASRGRWGATWAAVWYMAIVCGMVWILPLFKAQPLLAPIYLQVDRMVPPVFPFLLVIPAFAMDLVTQRYRDAQGFGRKWILAGALGVAFLALFMLAQWNFSAFLLSEGAQNRFFAGGRQWPYFIQTGPWRDEFWVKNGRGLNAQSALIALGLVMVASRAGMAMGGWMRRVQR
jgi:hypothetical protein